MDRTTQYFVSRGAEFLVDRVVHFQESSATSDLAAQRLNCECSQIAKSIAIFVKNPAARMGKLKHPKKNHVVAKELQGLSPIPVVPLYPENLCPIIIVASGDAKISKDKLRDRFHSPLNLISTSIVQNVIGHPLGGICPFGINSNVKVYLDVSMKRFNTVHAACGSHNTIITLSLEELEEYAENFVEWVDVCEGWLEKENMEGAL